MKKKHCEHNPKREENHGQQSCVPLGSDNDHPRAWTGLAICTCCGAAGPALCMKYCLRCAKALNACSFCGEPMPEPPKDKSLKTALGDKYPRAKKKVVEYDDDAYIYTDWSR
jgi:hypothetical protein